MSDSVHCYGALEVYLSTVGAVWRRCVRPGAAAAAAADEPRVE